MFPAPLDLSDDYDLYYIKKKTHLLSHPQVADTVKICKREICGAVYYTFSISSFGEIRKSDHRIR